MLSLGGKEPERIKMIEQAMKDKAPELTSFLKDREQSMMDSFDQAYAEAKLTILQQSNPDNAERLTMAQREMWADTLETWLEFADDDE